MEKIRWGIIGAGGIADRRAIPALLEDKNNEIVAVLDKAGDVAKMVAQKYGVKHYFTDVEELFKTVECDAVYIATPVFCHKEQALLALEYGVNVFMEKPISLNEKEGKEILDAFKAKGKQLTIGYMMGFHNLHQKAASLIKEGKLGSVNLFKMQFSCWYPEIAGAWRQKKALGGGGCIMDLAVHCMELFMNITGEDIEKIKGFFATRTFGYEVEDTAVITFKSESGILGHIDVNFNVPDSCAPSRLEIYGTDGSIFAEGTLGQEEVGKLRFLYAPQGGYEAQQIRTVTKPKSYCGKGANIYTKQFKVFGDIIKSGKCDYTCAERALRIQALCDEIYENNCY
ncbi:MAG: Gfo/Idh/MocA family oxidoreductase [Clostridia bacterium]|nr:Gfo/Idh/MocA family oxidoreductase [Clostridia bacterium]